MFAKNLVVFATYCKHNVEPRRHPSLFWSVVLNAFDRSQYNLRFNIPREHAMGNLEPGCSRLLSKPVSAPMRPKDPRHLTELTLPAKKMKHILNTSEICLQRPATINKLIVSTFRSWIHC